MWRGGSAAPAPLTPEEKRPDVAKSDCRSRSGVVRRLIGAGSEHTPGDYPPDSQENTMRFMMLVPADKSRGGALPDEKMLPRWGSTTRSWRRPACCSTRRRAASALQGRARALQRRQAHGDRRPVHRSQGAHRRLLADPGQVARGGHRVGQARAARRRRSSRSARSSSCRTSRRARRSSAPSSCGDEARQRAHGGQLEASSATRHADDCASCAGGGRCSDRRR